MRRFFTRLYGNETVKMRLGAAILREMQNHALLISGPDGSGKTTLAIEIAAALNCERKTGQISPLPCGTCNTCRRIYDGNYTDIKWLRREPSKATIGVEELRLFREDMFLSSTESAYKIYIIDEADRMTPNAQNALLKVLEEPPRAVMILLLAEESDKILTTIKSRAQLITMQRFTTSEIADYVIANGLSHSLDKDRLTEDVMSADGRIGKALEILDSPDTVEADRQIIENILSAMRTGAPYSELYNAISQLPQKRAELSEVLDQLSLAISDLVKVRFSSNAELSFFGNGERAKKLSADISPRKLMNAYDAVREAADDNSKNANISAITSSLGAKIKLI